MIPVGLIFLLSDPASLLGALLGLGAGTVLPPVVQALLARRLGDSAPARLQRRTSLDIRRHIDPFGVVAMILGGVGWSKPLDLDPRRLRGRGRLVLVVAAGPVVNLLLGAAALAALKLVSGGDLLLGLLGRVSVPDLDEARTLSAGAVVLALFGLTNVFLAALRLIPLPPLDAAHVLWAYAPRTPGWANVRYKLEEQNYGLAIVFLLLLPLFSGAGLLVRVVGAVSDPVLQALARLLV